MGNITFASAIIAEVFFYTARLLVKNTVAEKSRPSHSYTGGAKLAPPVIDIQPYNYAKHS